MRAKILALTFALMLTAVAHAQTAGRMTEERLRATDDKAA